ncbi:MAG: hypothetical protein G01um101413_694 [Parcubacteria group bacterium Gr01-1014_13]|nr:MAG: hypothetical protein G01um101413_694 [Parcubacteria group bacterium Gr01-1014_13]
MRKGILLAFAAAIALMGAGCTGNVGVNTNPTTTPYSAAQGKVIISITDAAAQMNGITSVQLTVDKIEMHSATQGWITVSNESKTFDLLALKAKSALALAAHTNVAQDTYNQIRLHVTKVLVVKSTSTVEAKLPSNNLEVNGKFTVVSGTTNSVKVDFVVDESLHITGKGKYIFSPVLKIESRTNANATITTDDMVTLTGGNVESNIEVGMDVNGTMRDNFKLKTDEKLEINADNTIKLLMSTSNLKIKADTGAKVEVGI